jgi:Ring finger domain
MPTKRRQIKKTKITNRKRKTQKKITRSRRKMTKRNRNNKKFRTRRNKKYFGGGNWIDNNTLSPDEECSICLEQFSETPQLAVYETDCGHKFHNNCLNRTCITAERAGNDLVCPICRADLETEYGMQCTDVYAFRNKRLDAVLDATNRAIYEAQPAVDENDNEIINENLEVEQPQGAVPDVGDIPHNNDDNIGQVRRIYDEEDEEEVSRDVNPVVGRCYDHVEATRREGRYPNIRYFAPSLNRVYVGRFVREERRGFGDGQQIYAIFVDNNGQERRVQYSYGGDTCFIELPCP